jgi:hypothetical protein
MVKLTGGKANVVANDLEPVTKLISTHEALLKAAKAEIIKLNVEI